MLNVLSKAVLIMLTTLLLVSTGCERYQVTLNEQPVYTPPTIFTDYELPDPGLDSCVTQTIKDQKITSASQLTRLVCTNGGIQSLEGLVVFSSLETLNLANNNLADISPLLFLGKLRNLNLQKNPHVSCELVAKLKVSGTFLSPEHCSP